MQTKNNQLTQKLFKKLDKNLDGILTFNEFISENLKKVELQERLDFIQQVKVYKRK